MAEAHSEPSDKLYLSIAGTLAVLTIVSYVADLMELPRQTLIATVLVVAVIKASLVAMFFMHLKVDWTKVKIMLIPAAFLSLFLVMALLPDITFALREKAGKKPPVEGSRPAATAKAGH